jgi:outer membrane protein assembly factor BamA
MKLMQIKQFIYIILGGILLYSCSVTKYVPEDRYLLNRVEVSIADETSTDINVGYMKSYVTQNENSRWFSSAKVPLFIYSLSGIDTAKWINRTLKALGEPPVIYDSLLSKQSCQNLRLELQNQGYLDANVTLREMYKGKKVSLNYLLQPGERYYVRNIKYEIQDSLIAKIPQITDNGQRLLYPNMIFNAKSLDDERKRITKILTNIGYYKFNKDYISFFADTIAGSKDIDLTLVLRLYHTKSNVDTLHSRYKIHNVVFKSADGVSDVDLRSRVLLNNSFIEPEEYYSAEDLRDTYNRFGRLQAVRYTNISFVEHADSNLLDCDIRLTTNKPHSISFQPEGTNTAGDLGIAASLTYQNRNIFKGSESFSIELRGAYEAIRGLEGYSNSNFEEYNIESSLMFPRFIAPFLSYDFRRRINATSEVVLMYNLQNRPEYYRRVLSAAWKYKWNDSDHHDSYQIDLLDLNYVFMPWISNRFREDYLEDNTNRNAILRYNYEDLFIMKFGFRYNYNNGNKAIKANIETAGNLLGLLSNVAEFKKNELGQNKLFNIAYAQYVKADVDYTKYFNIDTRNTIVFHAGLGIAYPYGNSTILPFEKRYFSGGANSVRGWSVRSLGPGRYKGTDGNIDFINQTGDMKIDVNLEYRTRLMGKLDGAIFVDAGNIWTLRYYDEQPGGQFDISTFYEELAVGYGVGLRLNFDFFTLRFDMGMKAVDPAYTGRKHYPILNHNFNRDFAFHFAVGMPF